MSITRVDLKKAQEEAAHLREENSRLKDRLRAKEKPEPKPVERIVYRQRPEDREQIAKLSEQLASRPKTVTKTKEVKRVVYERRPEDAVRIATLEAENDILRREIDALRDGEE